MSPLMPLGQAWFRINCEAVNPTSSLIVIEIQATGAGDRGDAIPPWRPLEGSRPRDPVHLSRAGVPLFDHEESVPLRGVRKVNDGFR